MMKIASMIFGMIIILGFNVKTDLPDWMEFIIVVVLIVGAIALILVPIIITYLERLP